MQFDGKVNLLYKKDHFPADAFLADQHFLLMNQKKINHPSVYNYSYY